MNGDSPRDWHPQDWALVVKALVEWAGPATEDPRPREQSARAFVKSAVAREGPSPE